MLSRSMPCGLKPPIIPHSLLNLFSSSVGDVVLQVTEKYLMLLFDATIKVLMDASNEISLLDSSGLTDTYCWHCLICVIV